MHQLLLLRHCILIAIEAVNDYGSEIFLSDGHANIVSELAG